jgi:hypothetical protein
MLGETVVPMAASDFKIQLTCRDGIRVLECVLSIRTGAGNDVGSRPPGVYPIQLEGRHKVGILVPIDDGQSQTALRFVVRGRSQVSMKTKISRFEGRRLDAHIQRDFARTVCVKLEQKVNGRRSRPVAVA